MLLIPFILLYVGVSIDIDESADNDMLGACNDIYCVASMFIVPFPSIHIFEQHEPASLPFIVISSLPLSHILMLEYPEFILCTYASSPESTVEAVTFGRVSWYSFAAKPPPNVAPTTIGQF